MSVLSLKGAANNVLIYVDEDAMSCNVFSYNATEGIAIVNNSFILWAKLFDNRRVAKIK